MIRLSEAHAKVRLSETVLKEDVDEAMRLYREALKQSIMDPRTGAIDISILVRKVFLFNFITLMKYLYSRYLFLDFAVLKTQLKFIFKTTGVSAHARQQQSELKAALKMVIEREIKSNTIRSRDLIEIWRRFSEEPITQQQFDVAVQGLESDDVLVRNGELIRINN